MVRNTNRILTLSYELMHQTRGGSVGRILEIARHAADNYMKLAKLCKFDKNTLFPKSQDSQSQDTQNQAPHPSKFKTGLWWFETLLSYFVSTSDFLSAGSDTLQPAMMAGMAGLAGMPRMTK